MSVQDALSFIRYCRQNISGEATDDKYSTVACLEDFVALAATEGFDFSDCELRRAHLIDWRMRLHHYSHSALEN